MATEYYWYLTSHFVLIVDLTVPCWQWSNWQLLTQLTEHCYPSHHCHHPTGQTTTTGVQCRVQCRGCSSASTLSSCSSTPNFKSPVSFYHLVLVTVMAWYVEHTTLLSTCPRCDHRLKKFVVTLASHLLVTALIKWRKSAGWFVRGNSMNTFVTNIILRVTVQLDWPQTLAPIVLSSLGWRLLSFVEQWKRSGKKYCINNLLYFNCREPVGLAALWVQCMTGELNLAIFRGHEFIKVSSSEQKESMKRWTKRFKLWWEVLSLAREDSKRGNDKPL